MALSESEKAVLDELEAQLAADPELSRRVKPLAWWTSETNRLRLAAGLAVLGVALFFSTVLFIDYAIFAIVGGLALLIAAFVIGFSGLKGLSQRAKALARERARNARR